MYITNNAALHVGGVVRRSEAVGYLYGSLPAFASTDRDAVHQEPDKLLAATVVASDIGWICFPVTLSVTLRRGWCCRVVS